MFNFLKKKTDNSTMRELWEKVNNPSLALSFNKIEKRNEELEYAISELKKDNKLLVNRLSMIKERFIDIEKIFRSSKYTRKQIEAMSIGEFNEHESDIDEEIRQGKFFLYE